MADLLMRSPRNEKICCALSARGGVVVFAARAACNGNVTDVKRKRNRHIYIYMCVCPGNSTTLVTTTACMLLGKIEAACALCVHVGPQVDEETLHGTKVCSVCRLGF